MIIDKQKILKAVKPRMMQVNGVDCGEVMIELFAEIDQLTSDLKYTQKALDDTSNAFEWLKDESDELRKDADHFRWLEKASDYDRERAIAHEDLRGYIDSITGKEDKHG